MRTLLILALASATGFAADAWMKVRDLKTGVEVRILKHGAKQAILGTMDEANDERIVVVVKNEQVAIQKADIDRLDARPAGSRVTRETRTTTNDPQQPDNVRTPLSRPPSSTGSSSSSVNIGSKPDFETVYRRTASAPAGRTDEQKF